MLMIRFAHQEKQCLGGGCQLPFYSTGTFSNMALLFVFVFNLKPLPSDMQQDGSGED